MIKRIRNEVKFLKLIFKSMFNVTKENGTVMAIVPLFTSTGWYSIDGGIKKKGTFVQALRETLFNDKD